MSGTVSKIHDSSTEKLIPPAFLTPSDIALFEMAKKKLGEVRRIILKAATIASLVDLPILLQGKLNEIVQEFLEYFEFLKVDVSGKSTNEAGDYYRQRSEQISNYSTSFFEISSSNLRLVILNTVNTYGNELTQGADLKITGLINSLDEEIGKAKELREELEKKAKTVVISDYALIFGSVEVKSRNLSRAWLTAAIIISTVFIWSLIFSINNEWFELTTFLSSYSNGTLSTKQIFNYPVIISKVLIVSFIIYLITFCFKQYSINKHLQVINQHRKNAINSYKLFEASLDKSEGSKNVLMLQLAKAIYELTHTGFLSRDDDAGSSKFIEWTKLVESRTNT